MTPQPKPTKRARPRRPAIPRRRPPVRKVALHRLGPKARVRWARDREWARYVYAQEDNRCAMLLAPTNAVVSVADRRDSGCCVRPCNLDAHHVFSKKAHPALRYVRANGIAVCRKHHRLAHQEPNWFLWWFEREFPERWAALASWRGGTR